MKRNIIYFMLIVLMALTAVILIKVTRQESMKYNSYKSKQVENQVITKDTNTNKNITKYSNVIHLVNKYKGEIKEFKNKSSSSIDADIIINGNEEKLSNFIGELRKTKSLNNINSICLNNQNEDEENYSLEVDAEFGKNK